MVVEAFLVWLKLLQGAMFFGGRLIFFHCSNTLFITFF